MENIYRSWTEFNKIQNQVFKGAGSMQILSQSSSNGEELKSQPYPRGEDWKYMKYNELPNTHFHFPQKDESSQQKADQDFTVIEIKNFNTPQKVQLGALPEGLCVESELEAQSILQLKNSAHNPFAGLSKSFVGLGLNLRFGQGYKNEKPVKLVFDLNGFSQKDLFLQQNISVAVEDSVEVDFFIEIQGEAFSGLCNICMSSKVAPQSKLLFYVKEVGGPQSHFVMNSEAFVEKAGLFKSLDMTLSSRWSRHNFSVNLIEPKAQGELYGAYLNQDDHFVDHHTSIRHEVGHTESREDYRGILAEKAQAVFNGKVFIAEKAAKSNSEQINKNLMLSRQAEVDTKPELQIFNDDVKAAHGATVGQLDEEQRFYLQSRGYSAEQAGRVLAKAFVYDLLDNETELVSQFYRKDLEKALIRLEESK